MARRTLEADQTYILDEADSSLQSALAQTKSKLSAMAVGQHEDETFCFRCSCDGFIMRSVNHGGLGLAKAACGRAGCGHLFTSHNVF